MEITGAVRPGHRLQGRLQQGVPTLRWEPALRVIPEWGCHLLEPALRVIAEKPCHPWEPAPQAIPEYSRWAQ